MGIGFNCIFRNLYHLTNTKLRVNGHLGASPELSSPKKGSRAVLAAVGKYIFSPIPEGLKPLNLLIKNQKIWISRCVAPEILCPD